MPGRGAPQAARGYFGTVLPRVPRPPILAEKDEFSSASAYAAHWGCSGMRAVPKRLASPRARTCVIPSSPHPLFRACPKSSLIANIRTVPLRAVHPITQAVPSPPEFGIGGLHQQHFNRRVPAEPRPRQIFHPGSLHPPLDCGDTSPQSPRSRVCAPRISSPALYRQQTWIIGTRRGIEREKPLAIARSRRTSNGSRRTAVARSKEFAGC